MVGIKNLHVDATIDSQYIYIYVRIYILYVNEALLHNWKGHWEMLKKELLSLLLFRSI